MNLRAVIFFILSIVAVIIALMIFFKGLDFKSLLFLLFGLAAVLLFRLGVKEMKKNN